MPKLKPYEHGDRGDGTCQICFEEFPCTVASTGAWRSPLREWEEEAREKERERREALEGERWRGISKMANALRINIGYLGRDPQFSVKVYTETLYKMLEEITKSRETPMLHTALREVADRLMKEDPPKVELAESLYDTADRMEDLELEDSDNKKEETIG